MVSGEKREGSMGACLTRKILKIEYNFLLDAYALALVPIG